MMLRVPSTLAAHIGVALQPEMITGCNVETPVAAAHRRGANGAVTEIAADRFVINAFQSAQIA